MKSYLKSSQCLVGSVNESFLLCVVFRNKVGQFSTRKARTERGTAPSGASSRAGKLGQVTETFLTRVDVLAADKRHPLLTCHH